MPLAPRVYVAVKHEVRRSDQTKPGPEIIQLEGLLHVKERETREYGHGDDFLQHFQLPQVVIPDADPVGGNLEHIFKEGYSPTSEDDKRQRLAAHVLQMAVPCERHENVGEEKQNDGS